jgi:hypothetical protein
VCCVVVDLDVNEFLKEMKEGGLNEWADVRLRMRCLTASWKSDDSWRRLLERLLWLWHPIPN